LVQPSQSRVVVVKGNKIHFVDPCPQRKGDYDRLSKRQTWRLEQQVD